MHVHIDLPVFVGRLRQLLGLQVFAPFFALGSLLAWFSRMRWLPDPYLVLIDQRHPACVFENQLSLDSL